MKVTLPDGQKIDIRRWPLFSVQLGHLEITFFIPPRKPRPQEMAKDDAEIIPQVHMPIIAVGWTDRTGQSGSEPFFQSLN